MIVAAHVVEHRLEVEAAAQHGAVSEDPGAQEQLGGHVEAAAQAPSALGARRFGRRDAEGRGADVRLLLAEPLVGELAPVGHAGQDGEGLRRAPAERFGLQRELERVVLVDIAGGDGQERAVVVGARVVDEAGIGVLGCELAAALQHPAHVEGDLVVARFHRPALHDELLGADVCFGEVAGYRFGDEVVAVARQVHMVQRGEAAVPEVRRLRIALLVGGREREHVPLQEEQIVRLGAQELSRCERCGRAHLVLHEDIAERGHFLRDVPDVLVDFLHRVEREHLHEVFLRNHPAHLVAFAVGVVVAGHDELGYAVAVEVGLQRRGEPHAVVPEVGDVLVNLLELGPRSPGLSRVDGHE